MKKAILIITGLLFLCPLVARAEEKPAPYDGKLRFTFKELPTFDEEYASGVSSAQKIAEDIDFKSFPGSWDFRTRLREGLKKGANFAGKYAVVTHGCGSGCQGNWIVNVETGKVLGNIGSSNGLKYKKESRLIIADMPEDPMNIDMDSLGHIRAIDYYMVYDDELEMIDRVSIRGMFPSLDEIQKEYQKNRDYWIERHSKEQ